MTDKGYLTLTLPVSEHHIITAKLIGAFIWSLISTACLTPMYLYYLIVQQILMQFNFLLFCHLLQNILPALVLLSYPSLLNTISGILCIYLAISIGQLFNEYRTALAVAAYIGIQIVIGIIEVFSIPVLTSMSIHLQDLMIISIWEQA